MRVSTGTAALGAALALLTPFAAYADAPKSKSGGASDSAAPMAIPLPADAIKRLKSGDPAQIKSALDDVRVSGRAGSPAVPAVADLLKQGLPPLSPRRRSRRSATPRARRRARCSAGTRTSATSRCGEPRSKPSARRAARSRSRRCGRPSPIPTRACAGCPPRRSASMKAKEAVGDLFVGARSQGRRGRRVDRPALRPGRVRAARRQARERAVRRRDGRPRSGALPRHRRT